MKHAALLLNPFTFHLSSLLSSPPRDCFPLSAFLKRERAQQGCPRSALAMCEGRGEQVWKVGRRVDTAAAQRGARSFAGQRLPDQPLLRTVAVVTALTSHRFSHTPTPLSAL